MKRLYIHSILLVLAFSQCRKENNNSSSSNSAISGHFTPSCPGSTVLISDTNMLECKFKAGTFWVFQDSITNNIDTLVVESLTPYTTGLIPYGIPHNPCPVEKLTMKTEFRNDTGDVLIHINYIIMNEGLFLSSEFYWTVGAQPVPYVFKSSNVTNSYKTNDSLYVFDRYYKNVGESYAIQFTAVENKDSPNRMYHQSFKTYFNTQFGFLQFDLRDRLTGQLTGRRKIISRNIIK